jgi:hypothetical protein
MPVWLNISLALISVIFPVGTLLVLAVRYGKAMQKVDSLQEDVAEIKVAIPACQRERRSNEKELHGRITNVANDQAAQNERTKALAEGLQWVRGKVNGNAPT